MPQRGYFGIGIVGCKKGVNVGTLWRSAYNFGAAFLVMIAARHPKVHQHQSSDTCKARRHLPYFIYPSFDDFRQHRPWNCPLVGIEQTADSRPVERFVHPEQAVYLLGAEDTGLPLAVMAHCSAVVHIPTPFCLNVAVAGSIIMYDRQTKALTR